MTLSEQFGGGTTKRTAGVGIAAELDEKALVSRIESFFNDDDDLQKTAQMIAIDKAVLAARRQGEPQQPLWRNRTDCAE